MRRWLTVVMVVAIAVGSVPCSGKPAVERVSRKDRKKDRRKKDRKQKTRKPRPAGAGTVRVNTPQSLRLAIEDLIETFGTRYSKGPQYLARLDRLDQRAKAGETSVEAELGALVSEALLASPLLDFDKLIVRRTADLGLPANWQSNSSLRGSRYDNEIATLSPPGPQGKLTTLYRPESQADFVGDIDLHFDARKLLFSRSSGQTWGVWEIGTDGAGPRKLPLIDTKGVDDYDACYLPDGSIIFTSTAGITGVPCVGGSSPATNLFRLDTAAGTIRRLTFDQDHNWCPTVLNSGRVMYLRWEYSDITHAFSRILFSVNPDGTGQGEFYGSNSYWPNGLFYARPIPGQPSRFVAIVTGHHGLRRMGELVLFDAAKGRYEADGVVQRIPGRGKPVEPVILDNVAGGASPRFLHPWPLSDPGTLRGAGKYFLAAAQVAGKARWGIYLVDVFDNVVLVKDDPTHHLVEPVPLRKTPRPDVVPDRTNPTRKDALVQIVDIYAGEGLAGVPRGTIKKLRLFTYTFAYYGMGGQGNRIGVDGPWYIKRIVGTVPVAADGSALFRVPANTPLSLQPLDADGKAVQRMRSWLTAMPGETLSCVGCHEPQNSVPPVKRPLAVRGKPAEITPWYGLPRGFDFGREIQKPVLDKYCIGCHGGSAGLTAGGKPRTDGSTGLTAGGKTPPDLTARPKEHRIFKIMRGRKGRKCNFTPSYWTLRGYVRSTNEADNHLLVPHEFGAGSSKLIQMFRKGHQNVKLDAEAWDRLITWIDLSAPAYGTWSENVGTAKVDKYRGFRSDLLKRYAGVDEDPEVIYPPTASPVAPIVPPPAAPRGAAAVRVAGWPFNAAEAKQRQARAGRQTKRTFDLGGGVTLEMVLVPPGAFVLGSATGHPDEGPPTRVEIARAFWMGKFEVTNAQFARFDAGHDSRLEAYPGNVFSVAHRGVMVNRPAQPVCRVTQLRAEAFCRWLGKATGQHFALPSEAQWEYACRAGTATPMYFGHADADHSTFANLADATSKKTWQWLHPGEGRFDDKAFVTADVGTYAPNAWGLHDMHGNVAEWTRSPYRPYPFRDADKSVRASPADTMAVRGGSWNDRAKNARSAFRLPYRRHELAFDVGFRVICLSGKR